MTDSNVGRAVEAFVCSGDDHGNEVQGPFLGTVLQDVGDKAVHAQLTVAGVLFENQCTLSEDAKAAAGGPDAGWFAQWAPEAVELPGPAEQAEPEGDEVIEEDEVPSEGD